MAKASEPMPFDTGSTSDSVIAVARAASTALPPSREHREARLRGERLRGADDVLRQNGLPRPGVGQLPRKRDGHWSDRRRLPSRWQQFAPRGVRCAGINITVLADDRPGLLRGTSP